MNKIVSRSVTGIGISIYTESSGRKILCLMEIKGISLLQIPGSTTKCSAQMVRLNNPISKKTFSRQRNR